MPPGDEKHQHRSQSSQHCDRHRGWRERRRTSTAPLSFSHAERVQAIHGHFRHPVQPSPERLVDVATASRLPSMFSAREYVEAGGLMSYGESFSRFLPALGDVCRQADQGREGG